MRQQQKSWDGVPSDTLMKLLNSYRTVTKEHDELLNGRGEVRPHWQGFVNALGAKELHELQAYGRESEEIVRQHGIVYNVYSDAKGMDRPWALDLFPVIIPRAEWAQIEAGVQQRLTVLNRMLADLYGEQSLLKNQVVPDAFVHANPQFRRVCHGIPGTPHGHITRYAVDLVRSADGQWTVYSDRTQAPSGAGYALENRVILAQVLPQLFAEGTIARLAEFFDTFRNSLTDIAPGETSDPTVVLHTPGPLNEVYFEHVYLARYLGINLLEGADLTVRDNFVYLKTIEGLKRVDVLLRRVDDAFSDPLELRRDSILGISGLLGAVRAGNVTVCNNVGSGLLEVAALNAVLPAVAQHMLGEELLLPSTPTRWGAIDADRAWMESHFDSLHLQSAFHGAEKTLAVSELSEDERRERYEAWKERPYDFVAVDPVTPSTVPVFSNNELVPNSLVLRVYATGGLEPDSIRVLPGGLARVSPHTHTFDISMQQGCGSKDVWVLSEGKTPFTSLLRDKGTPLPLRRSPRNLSSRLAENLLWLGRYCERTEATVRYVRHLLNQCSDEAGYRSMGALRNLLRAAPMGLFSKRADTRLSAAWTDDSAAPNDGYDWLRSLDRIQEVVFEAVFNGQQANTIASNILAVRRTAWVVRERFSEDDWRILNSFTLEFIQLQERRSRPALGEVLYALNQLVKGFAAFNGLLRENMTRESGQLFLDMGQRLERSSHTSHLVFRTLEQHTEHEEALLQALLSICDSPMTYRARYGNVFQAAPVIDLLICDDTNPRSVAYQLQRIVKQLRWLPEVGGAGLFNEEERIIERLNTRIRTTDANLLAHPNEQGTREALGQLLERCQNDLPRFASLLEQRYFIHTAPLRPLDGFGTGAPTS